MVKESDKGKYLYCDYGVAFDGKHPWTSGNDCTGNNVSFAFDNTSPSHADNCKSEFLVLGEEDTFHCNESFGASEKSLVLIL